LPLEQQQTGAGTFKNLGVFKPQYYDTIVIQQRV